VPRSLPERVRAASESNGACPERVRAASESNGDRHHTLAPQAHEILTATAKGARKFAEARLGSPREPCRPDLPFRSPAPIRDLCRRHRPTLCAASLPACRLRLVPAGLRLDPCEQSFSRATTISSDKLRRRLTSTPHRSAQFVRALRLRRPALLHAPFAIDAAAALPLQAKLNIPLIVTLHGYDATSTATLRRSAPGRVYLPPQSGAPTPAHAFVCVSEHIRRQALERGVPEAKLRVLPSELT